MRQPQPELIDATELIAWLNRGIRGLEEVDKLFNEEGEIVKILKDVVEHIQEEVEKTRFIPC